MTRVLIPLAIVGCIVALWLMQSEPETKAVQGNSTVRDTTAETNSTPVDRRIAVDRVTKSKKVDVPTVSTKAPTAPVEQPEAKDEAVEPPQGPFTIDLGHHTIHLKDDERKRVARFKLLLVTQTDTTRVEIRRRRRELVRMAYFLGSKRQADGAMGAAGKRRFERDLQERFQNVVRTGSIDSLTLENYRLESRAVDAGVAPE